MKDGITVVTGASGMLGGAVYRTLLDAGAQVEGWSFATQRAPNGTEFLPRPLSSDLNSRVSRVIHCAAMTDADACERASLSAAATNTFWPGRLAAQAALIGARFIYVSTDAVYDGADPDGLSREVDSPRPLSVYASTKLAGERAVRQVHPQATIVRTTMFGWTLPGKREKLAEEIVRGLVSRTPLKLWGDAIFSPLHVRQLAELLLALSEENYPGILNVGSRVPVSKYRFGLEIADAMGLDGSLIEETSVDDVSFAAHRTKNTALDVHRAKGVLGTIPTYLKGIELLAREFADGTVERLKGGRWP